MAGGRAPGGRWSLRQASGKEITRYDTTSLGEINRQALELSPELACTPYVFVPLEETSRVLDPGRDRDVVIHGDLTLVRRSRYPTYSSARQELGRGRSILRFCNPLDMGPRQYGNLVMMAVRGNGLELEHASEELKNDRLIVFQAVKQNPGAIVHASQESKAHPAIVLQAVQGEGLMLEHASIGLRDDDVIVVAAIEQNALALQFASERLRGDPRLVSAAVARNSRALEYASDNLRSDAAFVGEILRNHPEAQGYIRTELHTPSGHGQRTPEDGPQVRVAKRARPSM